MLRTPWSISRGQANHHSHHPHRRGHHHSHSDSRHNRHYSSRAPEGIHLRSCGDLSFSSSASLRRLVTPHAPHGSSGALYSEYALWKEEESEGGVEEENRWHARWQGCRGKYLEGYWDIVFPPLSLIHFRFLEQAVQMALLSGALYHVNNILELPHRSTAVQCSVDVYFWWALFREPTDDWPRSTYQKHLFCHTNELLPLSTQNLVHKTGNGTQLAFRPLTFTLSLLHNGLQYASGPFVHCYSFTGSLRWSDQGKLLLCLPLIKQNASSYSQLSTM